MKNLLLPAFILLAIFIFIPYSGNAEAGQWTSNKSVLSVVIEGNYIIIDTNSDASICGSPGRFVAPENERKNNVYAMAMAALLSGKLVSIYFDTDSCINGGNIILVMKIMK